MHAEEAAAGEEVRALRRKRRKALCAPSWSGDGAARGIDWGMVGGMEVYLRVGVGVFV